MKKYTNRFIAKSTTNNKVTIERPSLCKVILKRNNSY